MYRRVILTLVALLALPTVALTADPSAYIIEPADGAVVSNPIKVVFGLSGLGVAPAGVERDKTGHHHLIIDAELPYT